MSESSPDIPYKVVSTSHILSIATDAQTIKLYADNRESILAKGTFL